MNWKKLLERIKVFLFNVPATLKETFIWFIMSYLIPLLNILIIWGIRQSLVIDMSILNIILVTNAGFLTALFYLTFSLDKNRKLVYLTSIVTYAVTLILFTISIIQLEQNTSIFSLVIFQYAIGIIFLISIILGLISKYDEVEAYSRLRAKQAIKVGETEIKGQKIKI